MTSREVVLAKPAHHYDSYIDFWRLAEASSIKTIPVSEIDVADDTKIYVFTPINGEVMEKLPSWTTRRAKLVWWNLERWDDATRERSMAAVNGAVDAVWTSDRTYAARDPRLTYVLLAGHKGFGSRVLDRTYDVCHLSYLWGRRKETVDAIIDRGLRVAPEAWGRAQQDVTVARSHLMINMHQYENMNVVAPLRFAAAASYAIPIVSEHFGDIESHHLCAARGERWQLPQMIVEQLKDTARLRYYGHHLYEALCVTTNFGWEVLDAATRI